jgi:hypothetical protein
MQKILFFKLFTILLFGFFSCSLDTNLQSPNLHEIKNPLIAKSFNESNQNARQGCIFLPNYNYGEQYNSKCFYSLDPNNSNGLISEYWIELRNSSVGNSISIGDFAIELDNNNPQLKLVSADASLSSSYGVSPDGKIYFDGIGWCLNGYGQTGLKVRISYSGNSNVNPRLKLSSWNIGQSNAYFYGGTGSMIINLSAIKIGVTLTKNIYHDLCCGAQISPISIRRSGNFGQWVSWNGSSITVATDDQVEIKAAFENIGYPSNMSISANGQQTLIFYNYAQLLNLIIPPSNQGYTVFFRMEYVPDM